MLSYEDALGRILASIQPLPPETLPLGSCLRRVLARDVIAPISLPPFDNSSMDGYAVIAADIAEATESHPVRLTVTDEIPAGTAPMRPVERGAAARIYTGSMMPQGADAVVPVEDTVPSQDRGMVAVTLRSEAGEYIRRVGSDIAQGALALLEGSELQPAGLAFAASLGLSSLMVGAAPRVALIATGSELVQPGFSLLPGQIYNSNKFALEALCIEAGATVPITETVVDSVDALRESLERSAQMADVIVTAGGVSVGDYDLVKQIVEEGGGEIGFWRVAVRPGKPFVFGSFRGRYLFGLPGNPVSAMVTFELFVRPALRRLAGHPLAKCARTTVLAELLADVSHQPGRRSFQRSWTEWKSGRYVTTPVAGQSSHQISGMVQANSLLIVSEDRSELAKGSITEVMLLD